MSDAGALESNSNEPGRPDTAGGVVCDWKQRAARWAPAEDTGLEVSDGVSPPPIVKSRSRGTTLLGISNFARSRSSRHLPLQLPPACRSA